MSHTPFPPPLTAPDQLNAALRNEGFAVLDAAAVRALAGVSAEKLEVIAQDWNHLAPDRYLKDGGRYRSRRHASFVTQDGEAQAIPHRAHWQPVEYNALHGGMERWFEPVLDETMIRPEWLSLLRWLVNVASALRGEQPWFMEAHQFRIDTHGGIGRPTPEGAHRDGVDLVAVFLLAREGIKGGETRVFELTGPRGQRFTLREPWSVLLLDDKRMIHESTPIQPIAEAGHGHRDTLVVTLRSGGFQDPET
ncbi:2OG-Fe dioxygenase family protein [Ottowia thiooxydans]|uniref:2OG-Fe dioxygenase family protein n=1 Tax=Ottowia thiooxydans TaxID=219182 RepID=UPI00048AEBCF|nr:2OG-Fe dioxygenase family protein [Ottowia thiooxydans]